MDVIGVQDDQLGPKDRGLRTEDKRKSDKDYQQTTAKKSSHAIAPPL